MAGLFGPQSSVTSSHIQSICDTLEIPHMETRWDYRMKRDDYSVNLYPHPHALGQVCQIPNIKVVDTSPLSDITLTPQTREQTSVPDLYVAFLAIKKTGFSEKKNSSTKKISFFYLFSMQLFSADATMDF